MILKIWLNIETKKQNFSIRQYYIWGLFAPEIALLLPESICKPDYYTKKLQRTSTDFIHSFLSASLKEFPTFQKFSGLGSHP